MLCYVTCVGHQLVISGEVRICPEYQLTLWSTAFFLVEQYSDDLKLTDFSARVVKVG